MFDRLEIFRMAQGLAVHAAARQGAAAANVAHADTPGYRARDAAPFSEVYAAAAPDLRVTRHGHLRGPGAGAAGTVALRATDDPTSPNGNSVSLETEMLRAVEIRGQHDRALAIYRSGANILRTALGRG